MTAVTRRAPAEAVGQYMPLNQGGRPPPRWISAPLVEGAVRGGGTSASPPRGKV